MGKVQLTARKTTCTHRRQYCLGPFAWLPAGDIPRERSKYMQQVGRVASHVEKPFGCRAFPLGKSSPRKFNTAISRGTGCGTGLPSLRQTFNDLHAAHLF